MEKRIMFFWIFIGATVLISLIIIQAVCLVRCCNQRIRERMINAIYRYLVQASQDNWCIISDEYECVEYSIYLNMQLGISELRVLNYFTIMSCFEDEEAKEFSDRLHAIHQSGGFVMIVNTKNHAVLEITCKLNVLDGRVHYFLWFKTLTPLIAQLSQEKEQKQNIQKQFDNFKEAIDQLPIPIWIRDIDLSLLWCNKIYCTIVDIPKASVLQKNIQFANNQIDNIDSMFMAAQVMRTSTSNTVTCRKMRHEKMYIYNLTEVPYDGKIVGYATDDTISRNQLQLMSEELKMYHYILNKISSGIAVFNQELLLLFYNETYLEFSRIPQIKLHQKLHYSEVLRLIGKYGRSTYDTDINYHDYYNLKNMQKWRDNTQRVISFIDGTTWAIDIEQYRGNGFIFFYQNQTQKINKEKQSQSIIELYQELCEQCEIGIVIYTKMHKVFFYNKYFMWLWHIGDSILDVSYNEIINRMQQYIKNDELWTLYQQHTRQSVEQRVHVTGILKDITDKPIFFKSISLPNGFYAYTYQYKIAHTHSALNLISSQ